MVNLFLLLLSLLAVVKSIFVGFDIDESYAIAQAYRLLKGDRLLLDMWEPHQTSALGTALFMLPFLLITDGDTTGIVIYLRVVGSIVHLIIGYFLYRRAGKYFSANVSTLIFLMHINFLPKWVTSPEFEIMNYWASCVIFLSLLAWNEQQTKNIYLLTAGTALFGSVLCYPTMIILYPVYACAIWYLAKGSFKTKLRCLAMFTLPPLLMGLGFLLYLFSYMRFSAFCENISYIFMDSSHSTELAARFQGYLQELMALGKQILIYLPPAAVMTFLVYMCSCCRYFFQKRSQKHSRQNSGNSVLKSLPPIFQEFPGISQLILTLLLSLISIFVLLHIRQSFQGDANQFYLYFRFLLIGILGITGTFLNQKKNLQYFLLAILPGIFSVLASALVTNMTLEIALARIYIAVVGTCFIIGNLFHREKSGSAANFPETSTPAADSPKAASENTLLPYFTAATAVCFVLGLLVCKLLLVRVTGCIPVSIKMNMSPVTTGPAAGLLVENDLAAQYNTNIEVIRQYTSADDRLLYFGCENIYYLASDAEAATPSTQGTSVFNEMYLLYYEQHPEKLPNVVIIDKNFSTNPYYNYSYQNQIVLDWIAEEFADAQVIETDHLIILK